MGDTYYIQPIQPGRSAVFLKNPEKRIRGTNIIPIAIVTDLRSLITLPRNNPKEFPHNPTKNKAK